MKRLLTQINQVFDIVLAPFTFLCSIWMKAIVTVGTNYMRVSDFIFMRIGVLPIRDHYTQPLINPNKHLLHSLHEDRILPGINLNDLEQLNLLCKFNYNQELLQFPINRNVNNEISFYYNNGSFESADAEFLYNMVRYFKPKNIIEIGSGSSTLISLLALKKNSEEDQNYHCDFVCIEPYLQPWLEKTQAKIIRKKVEQLDIDFFKQLGKDDILFIDSSHIIRPQGDVLFEYLYLLPQMKSGVLIHIHDIFTPKDYRKEWIVKEHRLWNEQYIVESFLTCNNEFRVIGAVNYLSHKFTKELSSKCPIFAQQHNREPGSFWIQKN